VIRGDQW